MSFSESNLKDRLHRPLRDLRISVTDRCNFRCTYCMPEEVFGPDYPFLRHDQLLSFDEIARLSRIFVSLGVRKIRISGGEPLLRPGLPDLIRMLKAIVPEVSLTTNGALLAKNAEALRGAGLERINVSLDTLDENRFKRMSGGRGSASAVLQGIDCARKAGLQVKVNMVVQKGLNDQDILPMARYFRGTGIILRFIEFMDVGNSNGWNMTKVVSKQEILSAIHAEMPLEPLEALYPGEVATRYRYAGSTDEIGIISSVTEAFCSTCSRARISANGQLYTCLFAAEGLDLLSPLRANAPDEALEEMIVNRWKARTDRYSEERFLKTDRPKSKKVEMHFIGG